MDLERIQVLQQALLNGSKHLTALFGKSLEEIRLEYKLKDGQTPRTLIDTYSEQAILETIRKSGMFKGFVINAEESGLSGSENNCLYIDPYDGTSNAAINLPMSVMGIGVVEKGRLTASIVYNPFERKFFTAIKGSGAFTTDLARLQTDRKAISAKEKYAWVDALFNKNTTPRKLEWINRMQAAGFFQNIRITGSNIDYSAKIAEGRGHYQLTDAVGGYFDLCGSLLIDEAGGRMVNLLRKTPTPRDHVAIAVANPADLEDVLEITRVCYKDYKGFR